MIGANDVADDQAPFLVVSALVPYKRVELAVRAMAGRTERLIVVGDGPERRRLEALAGANVSFRGWVGDDELVALYASCRALVHPAVDDFGMVMVEALAAGKPVVVSREGGAAGVIRDGETGIFFDAPTVESLSAALVRMVLTGHRFDAGMLRQEARRFDRSVFEARFRESVERAALERQGATGEDVRTRRQRGLRLA